MISDEDKIMMETLYWWGIPTLFRCKNDPDPKNCDIALAGVPHSTGNGTTERDQHLGPRAVRNISAMLKRSHLDYKIDPWKENKIHDLGDVPFPEANNNDGSCYYSDLNYDCEGNCVAEIDCEGICGGEVFEDDCEVVNESR